MNNKKRQNKYSSKNITIRSSAAEYLTFIAATGDNPDSIEMRYEDENVWLTQKMMAELYDVTIPAINQHLKTLFEDYELHEDSVIKNYLITATDSKNYNTKHYNLQAIIAVEIIDIYSTALDYDSGAKTTIDFFKKVQNKLQTEISP